MSTPSVFLSDHQLARRFGVHRGTPWRWLRSDPTFPRPICLSRGCTRWRLVDIEAWETRKAKAALSAAKTEKP